MKSVCPRGICTAIFIATLFTEAMKWKQPECPSTDEWMKKMWYLYIKEYYSVIKKNEILPFMTTWTKQEIIMVSEISQAQKDKCHIISFICGIFKLISNWAIYI